MVIHHCLPFADERRSVKCLGSAAGVSFPSPPLPPAPTFFAPFCPMPSRACPAWKRLLRRLCSGELLCMASLEMKLQGTFIVPQVFITGLLFSSLYLLWSYDTSLIVRTSCNYATDHFRSLWSRFATGHFATIQYNMERMMNSEWWTLFRLVDAIKY